MKTFALVFSAIVVLLAWVYFKADQTALPTGARTAGETAYERVLREKTMRCGYIVWPPTIIKDPTTKEVSGFAHDLALAVADTLGLKVEWIEIQTGQQLEALKSKRIDFTCNDGPSDMRLGLYTAYSKPILFSRADLYVRTNDMRFDGNPGLLNDPATRFVVMDGDFSAEVARTEYPRAQAIALSQNADPSQMMLDVVSGKADVLFIDPSSMDLFLRNNPGTLRLLDIGGQPYVYPLTFGVLPEETDFLRLLNMGIDLVLYSGASDKIMDRYDPEHKLFLRPSLPYRP